MARNFLPDKMAPPLLSNWDQKGQIEITFNWIYILIAGAVILLFFALIIIQQKGESEENLASDVIQIMESILNSAGVSENTQNFVDTSGIADYTLYFSCAEGVGEVGIVGKGIPVQNNIDPLFAPSEIKTTQLIAWSLPFKFPYKAMDFLMVTSANTKYFVVGSNSFADEFMENTADFNVEKLRSISDLENADPGANYQVRVVDVDGTLFSGREVPSNFKLFPDDKVTAVSFVDPLRVVYYQKDRGIWKVLNSDPLPILSLSSEKDAAKYAAVFAGNDEIYKCNMEKALKRLKLVTGIYALKLTEMDSYHGSPLLRASSPDCYAQISGSANPTLQAARISYTSRINSCFANGYNACADSLIQSAASLSRINDNLEKKNCLTLY